MSTPASTTDHDLTLTRTYDAPRARVFKAFTDPTHMAQWWGPHGFTTPICRAEARAGGELYLEMAGPAGTPWEEPSPMYGSFVEVIEPEKIVFTAMLKNADGSIFLENLNTVTLTEADGKTTLTLHVRVLTAGPGSAEPLSGMREGWGQSLERLQAFVQAS
jgi:uncharacterized protein YndB with AHSA1/START domain